MKEHRFLSIFSGALLAAALVFELIGHFVSPDKGELYVLSTYDIVSRMVMRPLIFVLVGFLMMLLVVRRGGSFKDQKPCLVVGIVLIVGYYCAAALHCAQVGLPGILSYLLMTLTRIPVLFMIPGILLGIGCGTTCVQGRAHG